MMNYNGVCKWLFENYAPAFNFEKDGEQLLTVALKRGFIIQRGDIYEINHNYNQA